MTGSALFDFLIALVVLGGAVLLFMIAIDNLAPNAQFSKIAKIAVGVAALVALLFAIKGVFFGGGLVASPIGVIYFAIGIIVVLVVMYLVKLIVDYFVPDQYAEPILFVIGAIALIALLGLAATTLFSGGPILGTTGRPFLR